MIREYDCFALVGPTASGKTSISIKIAKKINGEVIGLDSRQIFKGMEIGTAQPSIEEMDGITHHLIGSLDPWMRVSAGEYARKVFDKIKIIKNKGKVPIICGGSGLYFRAVVKGLFDESSTDLLLREKLEIEYDFNPQILLEKLNKIDPEYSKIVHINNKRRLVRALEIYEITGKAPSEHYRNQKINNKLNIFTIYLDWNRQELNHRIIKRTKNMISEGWFDEVNKLNLMKKNITGLDSIGYREINLFLKGEIDKNQLEEKIIIGTRQFAKRQMQWFAKERLDLIISMNQLKVSEIIEILHCIMVSNR